MTDLTSLIRSFDRLASSDFARDLEARASLRRLLTDVDTIGAQLGVGTIAVECTTALRTWLDGGTHGWPDTTFVLEHLVPANDPLVFFAGFTRATNGVRGGVPALECIVARPELPDACRSYANRYQVDLSTCTPAQIVAATAGYRNGNCLTFFTEDVLGCPPGLQTFGVFLLEKFRGMFERDTVPLVERALGTASIVPQLDHDAWYAARCSWAVGHERFHQSGPLPLQAAMTEKLPAPAAAIEEFRADAGVYLEALDGRLPWSDAVLRFVTLDRCFRYPVVACNTDNFDAAAGLLLWRTLADGGVFAGSGWHPDRGRAAVTAELEKIRIIEQGSDRRTRDQHRTEYLVDRLGTPARGAVFGFPSDYPGA